MWGGGSACVWRWHSGAIGISVNSRYLLVRHTHVSARDGQLLKMALQGASRAVLQDRVGVSWPLMLRDHIGNVRAHLASEGLAVGGIRTTAGRQCYIATRLGLAREAQRSELAVAKAGVLRVLPALRVVERFNSNLPHLMCVGSTAKEWFTSRLPRLVAWFGMTVQADTVARETPRGRTRLPLRAQWSRMRPPQSAPALHSRAAPVDPPRLVASTCDEEGASRSMVRQMAAG